MIRFHRSPSPRHVIAVLAVAAASALVGCGSDEPPEITYGDILNEDAPGADDRAEAIDQFADGAPAMSDVADPDDVVVLLSVTALFEDTSMRTAIVQAALADPDITRGRLRTQFSHLDDGEASTQIDLIIEELETEGADVSAVTFFFLPDVVDHASLTDTRSAALRS